MRPGTAWAPPLVACAFVALLCTANCANAEEARYEVVVEAPGNLKSLVNSNLSLIRWRDADGRRGRIDADQLRRLFDQGKDEIERLIATEGYYAPTVTAELEQSSDRWIARYRIEPGDITTVGAIDLQFVGPIKEAPTNTPPDVDALRERWTLQSGDVFRQGEWEANKRRLLQGLLIRTYPFATITRSEAEVDVRSSKAKLTVVIASGPAVRFGPLQTTGLKRYPTETVRNLDPIGLGELYSQEKIFDFQRRLNDSGYFSRVEVSIEAAADPGTDPRSPFVQPVTDSTDAPATTADGSSAEAAPSAAPSSAPPSAPSSIPPPTPLPREVTLPLRVVVEENKSKQLSVGLGLSTNAGPRASLGYNFIGFLGGAKQLRTTLAVDRLKQALGADLIFPTTQAGSRYSISSFAKREDVQGEVTRGAGLSAKRAWGPEATERFTSIDYLYEQKDVSSIPQTSTQTLGATYGVTFRRTDNLLTPTIGYIASGQVGAGVRLKTGEPYSRIYGKAIRYQPIGTDNTLLVRGELGVVAGKTTETLPSALLFRAGGDGSVRGYGYQSLGVHQVDAIVGGRYLATGTIEGIHWLGPRYPNYGVAVFVDAGNAGNRFSDLKPVVGYGVGARWRSPVGTLDFDVAHGVQNGSTRVHFSLGVSF
ncbi:MAG: autotransporter assembly complex protein TamA [Burkholderiaceae bacterium]